MDASEIEMRACELAYEHAHGKRLGFAEISEEDQEVLLKEIRARVLRIEQHVTHDMLVRRIGEGRWMPQRFFAPAFITAVLMIATILIGLGIINLFSSR